VSKQEEPEAGWYTTLQEAASAALSEGDVEMDQIREIVFEGRKRNPIHEFRAKLQPPRE
jgi:hypothetical protein